MKNLIKILFLAIISPNVFAQQSFTIDDALKYAVEHNVNAQKAKISQTIAAQKVKETIGIGLPQISAQGKYNDYLKLPVTLLPNAIFGANDGGFTPVTMGTKQSASGGVTLSQLLFNGSYLVGLQASKAYRETADLAKEKTDISIKQGILLSYTAVLVVDENLKTLEQNKQVSEKTLNDTEVTYKTGLTEFQNVEQLQYNHKSLVTNFENLKRTREKLLSALKYMMGYPLDQPISLVSSLDELAQKNKNFILPGQNIDFSNHIDYRLSQNALKISELKLKNQKALSLPSLSGFINSSYNGYSGTMSFFDKSQQWFNTSVVGLQLDVPIFSGFQRKWQKQEAILEVKKSELDLEDIKRNLQNNAFSYAVDYENSYNSFKNAEELVKLSSSIYNKQQIKFKEGMGTSLELQQAETQLYSSQSTYYQSALNLVQAKTKLDEALGEL